MFIREMESSLPEIKPINQRPAINDNWRRYRRPSDYICRPESPEQRERGQNSPNPGQFKKCRMKHCFRHQSGLQNLKENHKSLLEWISNEIQGSNPRRYIIVNTKNILTNFKGVKYILIIGYSNMNHERLQKKLTPKWYEQFKAQIPEDQFVLLKEKGMKPGIFVSTRVVNVHKSHPMEHSATWI